MARGTWFEPLLWFVYASIAVTGICGMIYLASQQVYRQSLNDPQIQMAEDAALAISGGAAPASVMPRGVPTVDIQASLSSWIAVYDQGGKPLQSSGQLDSALPQPPLGLFDVSTWRSPQTQVVNDLKETRVTWQPASGVRQALVLVQTKQGLFVVAGRNMRATEDRIIGLGMNMLIGWLFTLGCLLVASFIGWRLLRY